jgi:hypothetical protein
VGFRQTVCAGCCRSLPCRRPGKAKKKNGKRKKFFIHVNVISDLFKKKFLAYLQEAYDAGELKFVGKTAALESPEAFKKLKAKLYAKKWVTYCKAPFGGPEQVLAYLAGYTHRVAISNHRLIKIEDGKVFFKWRDYRACPAAGQGWKNKGDAPGGV